MILPDQKYIYFGCGGVTIFFALFMIIGIKDVTKESKEQDEPPSPGIPKKSLSVSTTHSENALNANKKPQTILEKIKTII